MGRPSAEAFEAALPAASAAVLAAAVVVAVTAMHQQGATIAGHRTDVREGFAPWALAMFTCAVGASSVLMRRAVAGASPWTRISTVVLPGGLAGATFFFVVLGTSHFAPSLANAESPLGTLGTLVGSITIVLLVPAGLLLFAFALARTRSISVAGRCAAAIGVVVAVVGGGIFAAVPESDESIVIAVLMVVLGGLWCAAGIAVARSADRVSSPRTTR